MASRKAKLSGPARFRVLEQQKNKDGSSHYAIWDNEEERFLDDPSNCLNRFGIVEVQPDADGTRRYAVFFVDKGPWPDEGDDYTAFSYKHALEIKNQLNYDTAVAQRNKLELNALAYKGKG